MKSKEIEAKAGYAVLLFFAVLAIVFPVLGFIVDLRQGHNKAHDLFQRSGSIVTLLGVVIEYQLTFQAMERNRWASGTPISLRDLASNQNQTTLEKILRRYAHILVIFGTAIWGFGDLIFCFFRFPVAGLYPLPLKQASWLIQIALE